MISVSICSPDHSSAEQWDDLVLRASSNVFMNPAALMAASETDFANVQMLLAWEEGTGPARLVGLWALQLRKVIPFWPALLEALPYKYAFLSDPVIDPLFVADVIPAFLAAIACSALPKILSLRDFDVSSASFDAIVSSIAARGRKPLKVVGSERPMANREVGIKKSGSTRKKLRQDWNRLSALGEVDIVNDRGTEPVSVAFEEFLALENSSWKGANGTALLCKTADAAFVRQMIGNLAAQGAASVALLRLDGRAIAAQVVLYCGATAYTWKTAYSAEYAKYSPGALLVDKVTELLFGMPGIETIDSCSDGTGFMAQLWSARRPMADLLVEVGPRRSFRFVLEASRQRGYHRLRALRNQLRDKNWLPPRKTTPKSAISGHI